MTELSLAIDRLRAAINGDDFEWEIDGGSPFDDAKALLAAYDAQRAALQKIADLVDAEDVAEPLDDAIAIATAALATPPADRGGER
jgi:hypothetical protein